MLRPCALIAALVAAASPASADLVYEYTAGILAARATFQASGDQLTVILENVAVADIAAPGDVLTGVFFDVAGFAGTLTRQSALLTSTAGTPVLFPHKSNVPLLGYNAYAGPGDVGAEAGYRIGAPGPAGDHAIGLVGMDDFMGVTTRFDLDNSHNLYGTNSLNGIDYGIVNAGYTGGGNAPVNGKYPLIATGVKFTFSGFSGFSENDIANVWFNYGTGYGPREGELIPAPGALLLGVLGMGLAGRARRRPD